MCFVVGESVEADSNTPLLPNNERVFGAWLEPHDPGGVDGREHGSEGVEHAAKREPGHLDEMGFGWEVGCWLLLLV